MNKYQLSFDKDPQQLWQAVGLLTVLDDKERTNTFRVFVSGATERIVRDFIETQEDDCSIKLEVISDKESLIDSEETLFNVDKGMQFLTGEGTHETIPNYSQLNIGISRLHINTPEPYKIIYHVTMKDQTPEADNTSVVSAVDYSFEVAPSPVILKDKTWTHSISFEIANVRVKCNVERGIVIAYLEKDGKPQTLEREIKEGDVDCWLPEGGKPLDAGGKGEWKVIVKGVDSTSKCTLIYERGVNKNPSGTP